MRDLGVVLSQCAHVVVPHEEDSFEFDLEEELDIVGDDNGDSEETDDDYVPEGGSGSSGESDGEGREIQEEGVGTIQRGVGKIHKKGVGKIQKEGVGKVHTKKGEGKIQKEGVGDIQKKGVGKVHTKKGLSKIQKKGAGDSMKRGGGCNSKGRGGFRDGYRNAGIQEETFSYSTTPPQITWCAHKSQDASPDHALCRRHGRMGEQKE